MTDEEQSKTAVATPDPAALLDCALTAAAAAAAVHRAHAGRVEEAAWTEKGAADFVSHVDHEAEAEIVARIRACFPGHSILAEEAASAHQPSALSPSSAISHQPISHQPISHWEWIVDPLDGTTNFLHGYPMYGVSIAAVRNRVIETGVVMNTVTGQTWHATRGGGAYCDGEAIEVSSVREPKRALIGTGFPFKALHLLPDYLQQFDRVLRGTAGVRRAGSAALDLCHVASGFFDGFWELSLQPWDMAAGALIVREAGGLVTTVDGQHDILGPGSILAGNETIHLALTRLVGAHTIEGTDRHG